MAFRMIERTGHGSFPIHQARFASKWQVLSYVPVRRITSLKPDIRVRSGARISQTAPPSEHQPSLQDLDPRRPDHGSQDLDPPTPRRPNFDPYVGKGTRASENLDPPLPTLQDIIRQDTQIANLFLNFKAWLQNEQ